MTTDTLQQFMLDNRTLILQIRQAAHDLHASVNQTYGGTNPYGLHLDMVANYTANYAHLCCDDTHDLLAVVFGAYFHDSIEDARLTYNDVVARARQWLDDEHATLAAEIVYALTNEKGRTRAERANERYYAGIRATPYAPLVKLADRLANTAYSAQQQQPMLDIYRAELDHFLDSIDARSNDPRLQLPQDMTRLLRQISQSA